MMVGVLLTLQISVTAGEKKTKNIPRLVKGIKARLSGPHDFKPWPNKAIHLLASGTRGRALRALQSHNGVIKNCRDQITTQVLWSHDATGRCQVIKE